MRGIPFALARELVPLASSTTEALMEPLWRSVAEEAVSGNIPRRRGRGERERERERGGGARRRVFIADDGGRQVGMDERRPLTR